MMTTGVSASVATATQRSFLRGSGAAAPRRPFASAVRRVLLGLLRHGWWLARLLWVDFRRRPARTVLGGLLLGLGAWVWWASSRWQDHATAVVVALLVVVTLGVWRAHARRSFHWCVGRWWGAWWRRRFLYGPTWQTLAFRHGLYVTDHQQHPGLARSALVAWAGTASALRGPVGGSEVAHLRRVRHRQQPGGSVDLLLVILPAGVVPERVHAAAESLAHAWAARAVRVHAAGPSRVWVEVQYSDSLAHPVVLGSIARLDDPGTLTRYLEDGVTVGVHEDGTSWRLRLRGAHVLIAGTTGSGKSSLLWCVLAQLATAIHAGLVRVTWLDPKGGMEATPARPLADVIDRVDAMPDVLEDLVAELDQRSAGLAGVSRQHVPSVASPHRVVIVDELATLTALADSKTARRVEAALGALLSRGRAVGFTVLTTTVDPSKDVVRWRGLHAVRVAFRLDEPIQVDMVLGDGALSRGAACDRIPLVTPGVCFVRHDGDPEPSRARATYVTDHTIGQVTSQWAIPRSVADSPAEELDPVASSGGAS